MIPNPSCSGSTSNLSLWDLLWRALQKSLMRSGNSSRESWRRQWLRFPLSSRFVFNGSFRIFALDGNELGSYVVNTGGGASNYRTTNGPVPPGTYRVSNHRPGRTTLGMVLEGVGYSFDVDPTDGTQLFGRSLFRIHPDGNPLGTNGCLGVRESADRLRECENHIANLLSE